MSSTTSSTRPTIASLSARLDERDATLDAILARVTGTQPANVVETEASKPAKASKGKKGARKTTDRAVPATATTVEGHRCLTKRNRELFVADHPWAEAGTPTHVLVDQVITGGQPLVGAWAIGPRNVAKALGIEIEEDAEGKAINLPAALTREVQEAGVTRGQAARAQVNQSEIVDRLIAAGFTVEEIEAIRS